MELTILIFGIIALIAVAWILNRKPYTVIGKHHGDAYPHLYPPGSGGLNADSSGGPSLDSGQRTGSGDSSCGDGGGGNQ